ncbi:hypothetical protein DFQ01_14436 [Paenibacillus cellulosilyticus]|uniref:Uncharacterized protein n=1 Tax=Paenibacillus cellulosilyticus TaxID=375489 RepID=A0A2V2YE58_9BACL|nr:hypothetical protein [Paenibacillus cellulosilyticus]PWV90260.1 hypothetical protein DFQ01_14436 [Paenibacillus cellulosilyticus]QKS43418.1 hypothetical protein HUB94_02535 [Paenibacillus cellulosilyticus]
MPNHVDSGYVMSKPNGGGTKKQLWDTNGNLFQNDASLANVLLGAGTGYKVARGTVTPTSASHTVATGLTTVVAAVATLRGTPTLTHLWVGADVGNQSGAPAAGSILIKSWKPTASGDVTPIAATTPWGAVDWIAIGT